MSISPPSAHTGTRGIPPVEGCLETREVNETMSATQTEIVGMIRNERELIRKESAALTAAGVDGDAFDATLEKLEKRAVEANARQEDYKRKLKETTVEVEAAYDELYRTGSSLLDAMIGAVGKTSPAGKNFQRLRSRIRMPGDQVSEVTTPGETPPDAPR